MVATNDNLHKLISRYESTMYQSPIGKVLLAIGKKERPIFLFSSIATQGKCATLVNEPANRKEGICLPCERPLNLQNAVGGPAPRGNAEEMDRDEAFIDD